MLKYLKEDYEYLKKKRDWIGDFEKLVSWEKSLIKREKLCESIQKDVFKKKKRIEQSYNIENYVLFGSLPGRILRKFLMTGNNMLCIIITRSKRVYMGYKRVDVDEIKHKGLSYKIIPDYLLRLKKDNAGIWLENKMMMLNPQKINFLAADKVSARNWKNIFDEKLTNVVFNPKEKKTFEFDWKIIVALLAVVLVLLQAFGVVDLGQLINSLVGSRGG